MAMKQWLNSSSFGAVEYTKCISAEGLNSSLKCPGYDTKYSDSEASVMLELWGMQSIPSLPLLAVLLWSEVVAPKRFPFIGQTEMFNI